MTAPRTPLAQTVSVETPELVVFSYTLAGVGSRAAAALIDYGICLMGLVALFVLLALLVGARGFRTTAQLSDAWTLALMVVGQFAILWGYYVLFEGLADGQTPGKRLMRLRVVRDGGYSVTFGASAARNLMRVVDMQPAFTYALGIISVALTASAKRLGDIVAGTIVVREQLTSQPPLQPLPRHRRRGADAAESAIQPLAQPSLRDAEYTVLERFALRRMSLSAEARQALTAQLAQRFATALENVPGRGDLSRLLALYDAEQRARAAGSAGRHERGAARERHAIVARGAPRWVTFATKLAAAQRSGLQSLGEGGVREFVAEYRALAADLARLQTAARDTPADEIFYLSRLVAGAHNLLYRGAAFTMYDAVRFLAVDAPREVRRSWRPILFAAALLFGPAAIAYTAVVQQPAVADIFIPPQMLDRANEGVRRARAGTGYIEDPQIFRPLMASSIIANNVQVAFVAFAFGITAGIGTLLLLVLNGVSLGGVFGVYASKGIAALLVAFVAPHGVLELTAVCIAGGAGFLIAAALLVPGRKTRKAALVENGRRAIRLVGATSVLLLVAGTLEGFVSPIPWWPLELKLCVAAATVVGLVLYLSAGRERVPMAASLLGQAAEQEPSLLSLRALRGS